MPKITLGVTVSVGLQVGITGTNWGLTNFAFKIIDGNKNQGENNDA